MLHGLHGNFSRACYGRKPPRLAASTESHKNRHTYRGRPTKTNQNDKHSEKLPEGPIQAVVSVLFVLTDHSNAHLQFFSSEYF